MYCLRYKNLINITLLKNFSSILYIVKYIELFVVALWGTSTLLPNLAEVFLVEKMTHEINNTEFTTIILYNHVNDVVYGLPCTCYVIITRQL